LRSAEGAEVLQGVGTEPPAGEMVRPKARRRTAAEPELRVHRVADGEVLQAQLPPDAQVAGAVAWTAWGSGALPTEFRPSMCCGSVQLSSVSLLTGSASLASPPVRW
jgi:hypothetical protein